jgi:hypothetical protein
MDDQEKAALKPACIQAAARLRITANAEECVKLALELYRLAVAAEWEPPVDPNARLVTPI